MVNMAWMFSGICSGCIFFCYEKRFSNKKTEYPIVGRAYDEPDSYVECNYTLNKQGNRSAWTNKGENAEFLDVINSDPWEFNQGADIMPRTALFHELTKLPSLPENCRKPGKNEVK